MSRTRSRRFRIARWSLPVMALCIGATACKMETHAPGAPVSDSDAERVTIGGVDWYVDYDAALAVAREQDKAMWVHFGENPG